MKKHQSEWVGNPDKVANTIRHDPRCSLGKQRYSETALQRFRMTQVQQLHSRLSIRSNDTYRTANRTHSATTRQACFISYAQVLSENIFPLG